MPKSADTKLRTLYVADYLLKYCWGTDAITAKEIIEALEEEHGISADERSIYRDIETLKEFGYKIRSVRGSGYILEERPDGLTIEDMLLVKDAIMTSKAIPSNRSEELCKKLSNFGTNAQGAKLRGYRSTFYESKTATSDHTDIIMLFREAMGIDKLAESDDDILNEQEYEKQVRAQRKKATSFAQVVEFKFRWIGEQKTIRLAPYSVAIVEQKYIVQGLNIDTDKAEFFPLALISDAHIDTSSKKVDRAYIRKKLKELKKAIVENQQREKHYLLVIEFNPFIRERIQDYFDAYNDKEFIPVRRIEDIKREERWGTERAKRYSAGREQGATTKLPHEREYFVVSVPEHLADSVTRWIIQQEYMCRIVGPNYWKDELCAYIDSIKEDVLKPRRRQITADDVIAEYHRLGHDIPEDKSVD